MAKKANKINLNSKITRKELILYIVISYIFNIFLRYLLYFQISDNSNFFYNGEIIPIWTPDAGFYGSYANELLNGIKHSFNIRYSPSYFIYYIVKYTGLSVENVIFFAPAFLASLVVIPIILISNIYNLTKIGFLSTLFGGTFVSYYYRTHLGYFDTDILNLFFPLLAIYFFINFIHTKKIKNIIFAVINLIIFNIWFNSAIIIIISIIGVFILYLFFNLKENKYKIILFIILTIIVLFLLDAFLIKKVFKYINKNKDILIESKKNGLIHFIGSFKYVAETQLLDFSTFIKRVSGNSIYFILSLFGYITLIKKYRSFILTLPLVLITIISLKAGLRFTIYAVPIFAFTLTYGIKTIFDYILVKWGGFSSKISTISTYIFIIFIILFNIKNIVKYNSTLKPFYFSTTDDIEALKILDKVSNKKDIVIAPWDYGYLLEYYSNIKVVVNNNNSHSEDKYLTSIIIRNQNNRFTYNSSLFFMNKYIGHKRIIRDFLYKNPISYIDNFYKEDFKLPKIKRKTFILLHKSMLLTTYKAIEATSNFDLKTGKEYKSNLYNIFFLKRRYKRGDTLLDTTLRFKIDLKRGMILSSNIRENAKVKEIVIFNGNKKVFHRTYNTRNNIYILIQDREVLVMNRKLYNSFLVQALFLNNYDRDLFREVAKSRHLKIFEAIPPKK